MLKYLHNYNTIYKMDTFTQTLFKNFPLINFTVHTGKVYIMTMQDSNK